MPAHICCTHTMRKLEPMVDYNYNYWYGKQLYTKALTRLLQAAARCCERLQAGSQRKRRGDGNGKQDKEGKWERVGGALSGVVWNNRHNSKHFLRAMLPSFPSHRCSCHLDGGLLCADANLALQRQECISNVSCANCTTTSQKNAITHGAMRHASCHRFDKMRFPRRHLAHCEV